MAEPSERALEIADAVLTLFSTRVELVQAYDRIPDYESGETADSVCADEQKAFDEACTRLETVIDSK